VDNVVAWLAYTLRTQLSDLLLYESQPVHHTGGKAPRFLEKVGGGKCLDGYCGFRMMIWYFRGVPKPMLKSLSVAQEKPLNLMTQTFKKQSLASNGDVEVETIALSDSTV